jgi:hypothetical protein
MSFTYQSSAVAFTNPATINYTPPEGITISAVYVAYMGYSNYWQSCPFAPLYEYKTTNPGVGVNGYSDVYAAPLNNGQWTSWRSLNAASLVPGEEATFGLSCNDYYDDWGEGGIYSASGRGGFAFKYVYEWARPTQLKTMKVQQGTSIITLPLVSPTDAALEYNFLRVQLGSTVYCVDVVATSDSEASPVRFQKGSSIYAIRKVV